MPTTIFKRKFPSFPSSKAGFSLIELLVAISILVIGSAIIITSVVGIQRGSRDDQRLTDLKKIQLALQQYYTDYGYYPAFMALEYMDEVDNCPDPTQGHQSNLPCNPTKVYLRPLPMEYYQLLALSNNNLNNSSDTGAYQVHYCYQAYSSQTGASVNSPPCDNTNADRTKHCNYYQLFARLEGISTPKTPQCNPHQDQIPGITAANFFHNENYAIGPLSQ